MRKYIEMGVFSAGESIHYQAPQINRPVILVVVPQAGDEPIDDGILRTPEGGAGDYLVRFLFSISGVSEYFYQFSELEKSGSSQLLMAGQLGIAFGGAAGIPAQDVQSFDLHSNEQGQLSRADLLVTARDFEDAEHKAHDVLTPLLSWLSFRHDVALNISANDVTEIRTGVMRLCIFSMGVRKQIDLSTIPAGELTPQLRAVLSAYREGLNATETFYRFLCFFKVMEGVGRMRTPARNQKIKEKGQIPALPAEERFPASIEGMDVEDDITDSFRPYLGKRYGQVRDEMRSIMRNALAHLDPTLNPFMADNMRDLNRCRAAEPVVKYMARRMVENEMAAVGRDATEARGGSSEAVSEEMNKGTARAA